MFIYLFFFWIWIGDFSLFSSVLFEYNVKIPDYSTLSFILGQIRFSDFLLAVEEYDVQIISCMVLNICTVIVHWLLHGFIFCDLQYCGAGWHCGRPSSYMDAVLCALNHNFYPYKETPCYFTLSQGK